MREDVLPNITLGPPSTQEEVDWYFSQAYRDHLMALHARETDPMHIVFLMQEEQVVGFCNYVTYLSEDGKCFIVDYSIDKAHRGKRLGEQFFALLDAHTRAAGARYHALNLTNEGNLRFWTRMGFVPEGQDEHGSDIYVRREAIP